MLVYHKREAERVHFARPEGMPHLLHALLIQRGVASAAEAEAFLAPTEALLHDPLLLSDMDRAVSRLQSALAAGERVCVYGDYDVDGVCAAAILFLHLRSLGAKARVYLPDRQREGYGLNEEAVRALAADTDLLVSVDCGVNAVDMASLARRLGMDIVITDHHRPGETLPDCPVVDPLLNDYPCPHLSGAGVAFKLVEALSGRAAAMEYIDLAALSTVADVVPLLDENRFIVRAGLQRMNERPRPGVAALKRVAGLENRALTAGHLGFQLGPRLNAGGRLGSARRGLELLLTEDRARAEALAEELDAENSARRNVENAILDQAEEALRDFDFPARRAIVLAREGWNPGVLGLAASRLVEKYHYPAILLCEENGVLKGSCRSIPGVDIFAALSASGAVAGALRRPPAGGGADAVQGKSRTVHAGAGGVSAQKRTGGSLGAGAGIRIWRCAWANWTPAPWRRWKRCNPRAWAIPRRCSVAARAWRTLRRVGREGAHLRLSVRTKAAVSAA